MENFGIYLRINKENQMKNHIILFAVFVIFAMAPMSVAEDKLWSDEAELAFVSTGGNTQVMSVSGKNQLIYKFTPKFKGTWKVAALYGETDGVKTAESYFNELRFDYQFSERFFGYALGGWMKDEFAGFDNQYYLGPGVGYELFNGPKHFLSAEAGLLYSDDEFTDKRKKEYIAGRMYSKYEYAFTEKNSFSQSVEFLYDFDDSENYKVFTETAVKSALNDVLSLKASYTVKYNNRPIPETLDDTDTILAITLVVNF